MTEIAKETKNNLTLTSIQKFWPQLATNFKQSKVNLANAIELGKPIKLDKSELTLRYESIDAFHVTWLNKNRRIVEDALFDHFEDQVKITTQTVKSKKQDSMKSDGQNSKKAINKMLEEDPLINKLIKELGLELT